MKAYLLAAMYPPRCAACAAAGEVFCAGCWAGVALLRPPGCRRCGRPLERAAERCGDCPPEPLAWARAPFLYEGPVRRALMALKFRGARSVTGGLGPWLLRAFLDDLPPPPSRALPGAVLTWVPLGRRRRRDRGYDQAAELARALSSVSGWPLWPLLRRVVETPPQARLAGPERRRGLRGAFLATRRPPPRVVLVDDVLTSGTTAAECAGALVVAGAEEVGLLTAARSLGGPLPARCYTARAGSGPGLWLPGRGPPGSRRQPQAKRPT